MNSPVALRPHAPKPAPATAAARMAALIAEARDMADAHVNDLIRTIGECAKLAAEIEGPMFKPGVAEEARRLVEHLAGVAQRIDRADRA